MTEYAVFAELHIIGKIIIEAESLEEAKEKALSIDPDEYEFEYDYDCIEGAEPIAVYEADEDGFVIYSRPHLERVEEEVEGTWRRKERGV